MAIVVAAAAAMTILGTPVAGAQADRSGSTTQATLVRLYQRFLTGIRLRDTSSYRDILAPDYVYVGGDSGLVVAGRTARLTFDASSTDRWEVFEVERCDIVVRDVTAVGPCWYHVKGLSQGQRGDWHGISLVTFARSSAGQWQIAATRPSVLPAKP
jgi:hypothetical protein